MKKFVFLMSTVFIFSGCNVSSTKQPKEQHHQKQLAVFIDKCLEEQPNAMNNQVTRTALSDTIRDRLLKYRGDTLPILLDIPLEYEMCLQYPPRLFETFEAECDKNAGKYVVKFSYSEYFSDEKLSSKYQTTFQVFSILNKESVENLIDGAKYNINGKFRDFANNTQETGFVLPSGRCIISYPSVTSINDKPYIDLGTLIIDSIYFSKIDKHVK